VQPVPPLLDEETVYASFEEALGDRLLELRWRLSHLSRVHRPTLDIHYDLTALADSSLETSAQTSRLSLPEALARSSKLLWLRSIMLSCLVVMCILLGFDLMGLLVLTLR
jgi:hypothetical protein